MSQFTVNHVGYVAGAFAMAAMCMAAVMLLLVRRWRAANRVSQSDSNDL